SQTGRPFLSPAPVHRFSRTVAERPVGAPRLGEHTEAVRAAVASPVTRDDRPAMPPLSGERGAGALAGLRVLDLSQWLAGPAAAALLGDFGAEVIMVELPPAGPRQLRPE